MRHIILIDDEKIAMEGLYEVVVREFAECEVYKAASAAEALELFGRFRMDIAVIDINMPRVNGLDLQKVVQQKWPRCKCIFLTGYDRADYVRQAMRNGGVDYILKLEGDEVVLDSIRRNLEQLEEEEQKRLEDVRMRHVIAEKSRQIRSYLLHLLLTEEMTDEEDFLHRCGECGMEVNFESPVWMLVGKATEEEKSAEEDGRGERGAGRDMEAVQDIFQQMVEVDARRECVLDKSTAVWFFQPQEISGISGLYQMKCRDMRDQILQYLDLVADGFYEETGRNLSFLGMEEPSSLREIRQHYHYIRMGLLQMDFYMEGTSLLLKEDMILDRHRDFGREDADVFPLLCDYIREGMRKETYLVILSVLRDNGRITQRSFYECSLLVHRLIDRFGLQDWRDRNDDLDRLLEFHDFKSEFDIDYYFAELLHNIFRLMEEQGGMRKDKVLSAIIGYINSHISEDLSMDVLAEQVHFHPAYLSRLFKKKMGVTITDYITRARLNKAKSLLDETEERISRIAGQAGFASAAYFSRIFSRDTGMTPQEYRNRQRK